MPQWPDTVIDNFNRADAAVGAPWVNQYNFSSTGLAVSSNEVAPTGSQYGEMAYADSDYLALEQAAFITWKSGTFGSGGDFGVSVRTDGSAGGSAKGYRLSIFPGTEEWKINRVTSGSTQVQLGITITQAVVVGDTIRLTIEDDSAPYTIRAWLDDGSGWTEIMSVTDSTITDTGYPSAYIYNAAGSAKLDDFGGGTGIGDSLAIRPNYSKFPKYKLRP